MASYIGKPIWLISHSDIRYRGILHSIDAAQATIQLSNVYSMGTETRKPDPEYIPPQETPFEFILFRADEVKDIKVDDAPFPPVRNVHNDPAVIGVSQGTPVGQAHNNNYSAAYNANVVPPPPPAVPVQVAPPAASEPSPPEPPVRASTSQPKRREANGRHPHNPDAVRSAAASLENVERAMGSLRVGDASRNGRRNVMSNDDIQAGNIQVPATDFDFERSNAKFDKVVAKPPLRSDSESSDEDTNPSDTEAVKKEKEKEKEKKEAAYNPSKSFFDSLTPNSLGPRGGISNGHTRGGAGRGRGRGYGRSRREEEAQRNILTFGEAIPPSHTSRRGTGRRGGFSSHVAVSNGRPG